MPLTHSHQSLQVLTFAEIISAKRCSVWLGLVVISGSRGMNLAVRSRFAVEE